MKRVGIFANTFEPVFGAKAGGHVHFIEVAKRWRDLELYVFAPEIARSDIARELPDAYFVSMPSCDRFTNNHQLRNLARVVLCGFRWRDIRSCDALLITSHFLPDVLPGLFAANRMAVCIHHIIKRLNDAEQNGVGSRISSVFQAFSLALIRTFARTIFVHTPEVPAQAGIDEKKTHVVLMRNGIEHLRVADDEKPVPSCDALYLGRLVPSKGVEDLIRAWRIVTLINPAASLTIAGHGSEAYVAYLRSEASRLEVLDRIRFTGSVSDNEKNGLFASARAFVFPSKEEGWGIVLAEAMSHGLPCVTYDLPAFRHDFTRGRLVAPVSDISTFAGCIVALLSDEAFRLRMSSEGRALAATFSWDAAAEIEYAALLAIAR